MRPGRRHGAGLVVTALALAGALEAQTLASSVTALRDGTLRFSYAAREGVCGRGNNVSTRAHSDEWESDCEPGPVRIAAQVEGGRVTRIRAYVGGRWRASDGRVEDLGLVGVREAVNWLESLARSTESLSGDPVFPMTLADSVTPWDAIIRIARTESLPSSRRQSALFWLGQGAGAVASAHLEEVAMSDTDRRLRDQAVFALSQLRDGAGIPALLRLARTNDDPRVRRTAFFWLGQSKDPRALALFEEVLAGRR